MRKSHFEEKRAFLNQCTSVTHRLQEEFLGLLEWNPTNHAPLKRASRCTSMTGNFSRSTFRSLWSLSGTSCSKLSFRRHLVFLTIKDLSKLISLYVKIIHRFQVYRQTLWEKAILKKNELSWTSVPASPCTFQTAKSEMRPTFQNIDCFKDETGSLMLPTHENIKQEQQQQICGRKRGRGRSAWVANWNLTGWHRSGGWEQEDSPNKNIITQQHNNQPKERS